MFARNRKLRRVPQRGMTLLEIMIVLAILALVMGLVVGPKVMKLFGESKVDVARMTVEKYANEAFPQWSAHNHGCPQQLADLNDYMNNKDTKDPWGTDYQMVCGDQAPTGAHGIAITSAGEDMKMGTCDDIKSWDADSGPDACKK